MTPIERRAKSAELRKILETMNIPSFRLQQMNDGNISWLKRNIFFQNADHPQIDSALQLLRELSN
jgi:hypothetical protein